MPPEVRGSRNLGQIKAIHAGVNPPLNKEIIWFDKNTGIKLHKVYNYDLSQWVPLGGSSSIVNGIYTYLAYASSCDGAEFSLTLEEGSTHISIITSSTIINTVDLLPELFDGRWIRFCSSNESGGNYVYLGFADDEEGTNFSTVPSYEVECEECVSVEEYTPLNPQSVNYTITPINGGFNLNINDIAPKTVEINLQQNDANLTSNVEYCIEVQIPANWNSNFYVRLDNNEVGGYQVIPNGQPQTLRFKKINLSSKLIIEFFDIQNTVLDDALFFKVSNGVCCDGETTTCKKIRKCWALLISDEKIESSDITADKFEGLWYCPGCGCGNDCGGTDVSNLQSQISNLYNLQNDNYAELVDSLANLTSLYGSLQQNLNTQIEDLNEIIVNNNNTINDILSEINIQINSIISDLGDTNTSIEGLVSQLSDDVFNNRVINIISEYNISNPQVIDIVNNGIVDAINYSIAAGKPLNYYTNKSATNSSWILPKISDTLHQRIVVKNSSTVLKISSQSPDMIVDIADSVDQVSLTPAQVYEFYNNGESWIIINKL